MSTGGTSWDTATPITLPYTSDPAPASDYPMGTHRPFCAAWFTFTAEEKVLLSVDSLATSGVDDIDTQIEVYVGADEASKVLVAFNDDVQHSGLSKARWVAQPGVEYHIALGMWGQGPAIDGSTGPAGVTYVLTGQLMPSPENLTPFTPPTPRQPPFYPSNGSVYSADVSPSGTHIAFIRSGFHAVESVTPEQYPYNPVEEDGILIGKRVGDDLVTLFEKDHYDSTTFATPRSSYPTLFGYYTIGPPRWITDTLLIQPVSVHQGTEGSGTIPHVGNYILYSVSGDTVTHGAWFEVPVGGEGGLGAEGQANYPWHTIRPVGFVNGRAYMLGQRFYGGYLGDFYLLSFAVSGTTPSDFTSIHIGSHYQYNVIGWWQDSLLALVYETDNVHGVTGTRLVVLGLDGVEQKSYDAQANTTLKRLALIAGTSAGNRAAWFFDAVNGATQSIRVTRLDVETGALGTPTLIGTTMTVADGGTDGLPFIEGVYAVSPTRAVINWDAVEDATTYWDKTRAIFLDISDPSTLSIIGDYSVVDASWYDPDNVVYIETHANSPAFGPDWGIVQMRDYGNSSPWSYYWVGPDEVVVPIPVPSFIAPGLTADLLDSGARYE